MAAEKPLAQSSQAAKQKALVSQGEWPWEQGDCHLRLCLHLQGVPWEHPRSLNLTVPVPEASSSLGLGAGERDELKAEFLPLGG